MITKVNTSMLRSFFVILLIASWILWIGMIARADTREMVVLGILSGTAFLIFSMQWIVQHLMPGKNSRRAKAGIS